MDEAEASAQQATPRVLIFIIALACGLFLALAVHIALTAQGAGLTSALRELFPTSTDQFKSALAWWAIGIAGCLGSWGTILLLRTTFPAAVEIFVRPALGLVFFALLAAAGHAAASAAPGKLGMITIINLAAMALGAFMAFFAAHFAARR